MNEDSFGAMLNQNQKPNWYKAPAQFDIMIHKKNKDLLEWLWNTTQENISTVSSDSWFIPES